MKIAGRDIEQRYITQGTRILLYGIGGYLATLCSPGGHASLAVGLLAALWPGRGSAAVLAGSFLGAASFLSFGPALRCCGTLILAAAIISTFRDTKWSEHTLFRPFCAAAAVFCVELAYTLKLGLTQDGSVRLAGHTTLTLALCHYWSLLLRRTALPRRQEKREAQELRTRLRMSADALRSIYETICPPTPKQEENPSVVFDRAAEVVCRGCALCEVCWNREYISTFNAFNDATPAILNRGRAEKSDFAMHFASRCIHFPQLISAINTEVSALLLRRQYRRQLDNERQRTRGQYAQLSELVVQALSAPEELSAAAKKEIPWEVALNSIPKNGQRVCGDSITYFKGGGKLHLLLSDGMGSGLEAQRESKLALRLLEQFLTAGIEAETALRTLNAALNLRADEQGSFTTIDLLSIDPESGQAELCKYGAAPTYIKRRGAVRRITGTALPAGLQASDSRITPIRFPLEAESFVLMVSDGIADSCDDGWLQDLLAGWQGEDPNVLVSLVMSECQKRRSGDDDCSALCLYLPTQKQGHREV